LNGREKKAHWPLESEKEQKIIWPGTGETRKGTSEDTLGKKNFRNVEGVQVPCSHVRKKELHGKTKKKANNKHWSRPAAIGPGQEDICGTEMVNKGNRPT